MDNVLKPGEEQASRARGGLILYYLSVGTVERIFADGTRQTVTPKTGQSLVNPESAPTL